MSALTRTIVVLILAAASCFGGGQLVRVVHITPTLCAAPCKRTAVLFFHGLTGSRETWISPQTHFDWPQELTRDSDFRDALDVYRVDYDSYFFE